MLNTLKDMVATYSRNLFTLLPAYSPSLDDGSELRHYIEANGIRTL